MNTEVNMKAKQTQQCKLDILLNQFMTDKNFYLVFFFFFFLRNASDYAIKMGCKLFHADMFYVVIKNVSQGL